LTAGTEKREPRRIGTEWYLTESRGSEKPFQDSCRRRIALVFVAGASANITPRNITWTISDTNFYRGSWSPTGTVYTEVATLSGSFSTDNAVTTVTDFSHLVITAQPDYSAFAFSIAGVVNDYLPGTIGIFSAGWSNYIDLYLTTPLTSAGGSHSFTAGYDCPGCAVLLPDSGGVSGAGQIVSQNTATTTPEPGFYALLGVGLAGLGFAVKRTKATAR